MNTVYGSSVCGNDLFQLRNCQNKVFDDDNMNKETIRCVEGSHDSLVFYPENSPSKPGLVGEASPGLALCSRFIDFPVCFTSKPAVNVSSYSMCNLESSCGPIDTFS